MSQWHTWNGGACPVHPGAMCRFRFRNGKESQVDQRASGFVWADRSEPFDIVAYRVIIVPEEARG